MAEYSSQNGQFYKVTDKDTGSFISVGELKEGEFLNTIHVVDFINQFEYEQLIQHGNESSLSSGIQLNI